MSQITDLTKEDLLLLNGLVLLRKQEVKDWDSAYRLDKVQDKLKKLIEGSG